MIVVEDDSSQQTFSDSVNQALYMYWQGNLNTVRKFT